MRLAVALVAALLAIAAPALAACPGTPSVVIAGSVVDYWRTQPGWTVGTTARQRLRLPGAIGCVEVQVFRTDAAGTVTFAVYDDILATKLGESPPQNVATWPTASQSGVWQTVPLIASPTGDAWIALLPTGLTAGFARWDATTDVYAGPSYAVQDVGAGCPAATGCTTQDFLLRVFPPAGTTPRPTSSSTPSSTATPTSSGAPQPTGTAVMASTLLRATYEPLAAGVNAEILADSFVAAPDVRALEPLCLPDLSGASCATFTIVAAAGASKRIEMRAYDATGLRSALSNAIIVTLPTATPAGPSATATPVPSRTATALPSATRTATAIPSPTRTATPVPSRTPTPVRTVTPVPTTTPPHPPTLRAIDVLFSDGSVGRFTR